MGECLSIASSCRHGASGVVDSMHGSGVKGNSNRVIRRPSRRYAVGVILLAGVLSLLPAPVASQGDSAVVLVVRVIEGDTIASS